MPTVYTIGMKPTSLDLRERVVAARMEDGQSLGEIAERFRIPKGTVQNIVERYRDAQTCEPCPQNAGRKAGLSPAQLAQLERAVLSQPDSTLERLKQSLELPVSVVTVHNSLKRMGFTLKKSRYERVSNNATT